ncbi:Cytosolic sulfotransferase 15 [Vitis vinifera]|uniref:Sulfotransferase n=1 Tax=Vitis vinifera TaxID=29760 RepID=A0A438IBW3_VITVI|nr:Cytosolic sulfotransferase 15 [Vitis vinifera]
MEKSEVPQEEPCKDDEFQKLLLTLPEERNWDGTSLYLYQGFWCPSIAIKPVFSFQQHFQALDSDLILASTPKIRIFATHVPYGSLPSSIKESDCRIVYVCRNAVDQLISYWHFALKLRRGNVKPLSLDEGFEKFCHGVHSFGPFAEHVGRVLGMSIFCHGRKQGVIQEICGLCSFENLKDLEVNKSGKRPSGVPNSAFFRNGKVGDWGDHLSPSKAEYLEKLIEEKLSGSGLTLKICPKFQKEDECKPSSEMEA